MIDNNTIVHKWHQSNPTKNDIMIRHDKLKQDGYHLGLLEFSTYDLPPTPTLTAFIDESLLSDPLQGLFGHLADFGLYPVVYQGENDGRLVRNVVPRQGMENKISSYGSKYSFLPHVDNPDLCLRSERHLRPDLSPCPDTLTLLCLRPRDNVGTSLVLLDDIISDLNSYEIQLLTESAFSVVRPESFNTKSTLSELAVLAQDDGFYISRFDYHNVYSDSLRHQAVLDKFKNLSIDKSKWKTFNLKAGEFITFDNQRVLHTRDGFVPKFDGLDRWLIRVFGLYQQPKSDYLLSSDCNHHLKV